MQVGDYVILRKAHACGTNRWQVARLGADVCLVCLFCRRRVYLPRDEFERRLRQHLPSEERENASPDD
jgi:hypothetical protein